MPAPTVHPCGTPGLGLSDRVGCYCERGLDPAFWAEPFNAASNLAFVVGAVLAAAQLRRARPSHGAGILALMILLMVCVGAGSFLFHTFATRWAALADIVPIGLFVFAYTVLAWTWFVGWPVWGAVAAAALATAATFAMPPGLGGSSMYIPALVMLTGTAGLLWRRAHPARLWLAAAAAVFLVSLTLRTLDSHAPLCGDIGIGTHWLWHILNAVTLYLLVTGAIQHAAARFTSSAT